MRFPRKTILLRSIDVNDAEIWNVMPDEGLPLEHLQAKYDG